MSLLKKVLKLAQDLDSKGLTDEADVLDKFAATLDEAQLASGDRLSMKDQHEADKVLNRDEPSKELFMEFFNLFFDELVSEGEPIYSAAAKAVRRATEVGKDMDSGFDYDADPEAELGDLDFSKDDDFTREDDHEFREKQTELFKDPSREN